MKCSSIEFCNYRNIESETVSFSDGINVLWGKNAQGKSNILEGVYYFARGRSFRGAKDRELIRFGDDFARLEMKCRAKADRYDTDLQIIMTRDGAKKKVYREKAQLSGISELIGSFRAVLFCPAHLTLVTGAPQNRRSFLDIAISQLSPSYISELSKYNRSLIQRNALIKEASKGERISKSLWEIYAEQLAKSAAYIATRRFEYMSMLSGEMEKLFFEMTGGGEVPALSYISHVLKGKSVDDETQAAELDCVKGISFGGEDISPDGLYEKLTSDIDREIKYGSTLWGIHKDDIRIRLNGKDAKVYASQGQIRSLALAMKLSEGELSGKIGNEEPVFLLDDVLSELDEYRRAFVLNSLCDRQIIVTSCEPSLFDSVSGDVNLMKVEGGRVAPAE